MPSDKFLEYRRYVDSLKANSKGNVEPASYDEWLQFEENNLTDSVRNLELTSAMASGDVPRVPNLRTAADGVLHEYGYHATAYMTALARSRIARLTSIIAYCDKVEDKIMEVMDADKMDPAQLMKAYYLLSQTIASNTDLIKYMLDYSRKMPVDPNREFDILEYADKVGDGTYQEALNDKHTRDKLRNAVQMLISGGTPLLLNSNPVPVPVTAVTKKPNGKVKKRK